MPSTENAPLRLPPAFRAAMRAREGAHTHRVKELVREQRLSTVCEEARCPNLGECFASGTATFMICGDRCTRRCHFCDVTTAKPFALDPEEPRRLQHAARSLGLAHVVVTSVDRDDLADKGAHHWAACIRALKELDGVVVEVLVPDFGGDRALAHVVLAAQPDVFNHNLETVARLYKAVRPQSSWAHTQQLLAHAAARGFTTKSGIMVGLGETDDEVLATLDLMRELGVSIATIGQYLRPSLDHRAVDRYVDDDAYARFRDHGEKLGLAHVFAGPFVRSSYHAAEALRSTHKAPATSLRVLP
jgi:lipoic acid synthetase